MMSAPARLIAVRCSSATASPSIQPLLGRGLDHRVLARHVVRRDRHVDLGAHRGDHVEVGERRLHHHHVGALGDVERGSPRAPRGRCASPAGSPCGRRRRRCARRPRRGTGRRAPTRTWPSRRGSRCRRGRRSSSAARMARDLAVHHPARRDDVGAGVGLGDRGPRVQLERGVVVDLARRRSSTPQWPWSVYSSRQQVGDEHEVVAHLVAQVAERELHDAVGVPRLAARRRPCAPARRRGSTAGMPRSASSRTSLRSDSRVCCTTPGSERSAAARRCPRGRTAGRRGRRPAAASRRRGGGARACGAAGEDGERGRSPSNPTAGGHQRAPRPSPGSCAPRAPRSLRSPHRRPRPQ